MTSAQKASVKNTIILLSNNFVAIIHILEYNKYQIYTFLLEPLAKKVCSVSFVSQYISKLISNKRCLNFINARLHFHYFRCLCVCVLRGSMAIYDLWFGLDKSIGHTLLYCQGALMPGSDKTCNQLPIQFFLIS